MSSVVPDASGRIAFLRSEPGSDVVGPALSDAAISSVNLSEVLAKASENPKGFESANSAFGDCTCASSRSTKSEQ